MKKVIERMNQSVEELKKSQGPAQGQGAAAPKDKQKKWLFRRASGNTVPTGAKGEQPPDDEGDGMRVDFYLVVFLKFIASIVPTIEVDSTTSF